MDTQQVSQHDRSFSAAGAQQPPSKSARSIQAFCSAWDLSVPTFYRLKKKGLMPEVLEVGGRRLVTSEAERAWQERMKQVQAAHKAAA